MKYQDNRHFSHDHFLFSLKIHDEDDEEDRLCNACQDKVTEPFHGCIKCCYYLHDHCLRAPRSLQHQSHPSHPLTLLSIPTYSHQSYRCDACGGPGNGFSYGCAHCEFDLHFKCASFPNSVMLAGMHPHELTLKFNTCRCGPVGTLLECNVCGVFFFEDNLWIYYCSERKFRAHLNCVNATDGAEEKEEERSPNDLSVEMKEFGGIKEEENIAGSKAEDSNTIKSNEESNEALENQIKNCRQRIKRLINLKN